MWWAVVPATLSALLVVFVREPTRHLHAEPVAEVVSTGPTTGVTDEPLTHEPLPRRYWMVTGVLVTIALVNFSDVLLLLRVIELGFSTTEVVLAYVLFNAVYTLLSYPAGALTDRWPRPVVYAIGLVAFGVCYFGLGVTHGGATTYVLVGVYGLFPAFTDGVGKAWIASLVPRRHLGRAQGTFQALNSGAVLVAGVWAGVLWRVGPGRGVLPLVIAGSVAFAAAVTLVGVTVRQRSATTG